MTACLTRVMKTPTIGALRGGRLPRRRREPPAYGYEAGETHRGARLVETILTGVDLTQADLREADLRKTQAQNTVFRHADLRRARRSTDHR